MESKRETVEEKIRKGLEDVENGLVFPWSDVERRLDYLMLVDIDYLSNNYEKAKEPYQELIELIGVCDDQKQAAQDFYILGQQFYEFHKPIILYARLFFELSLDYGMKEASYYLATIYEWEKESDDVKHDPERINELYGIAAKEAGDVKVKKLATEKFKK